MEKKGFRIAGFVLLVIGIGMTLEGSGITGFVVSEDFGKEISSILGLICIILSVLILSLGEHGFRGTDSLRRHNQEAEWLIRRDYFENYGRFPSKEELRRFKRKKHETRELPAIVEEYKRTG